MPAIDWTAHDEQWSETESEEEEEREEEEEEEEEKKVESTKLPVYS